MTVTSTPPAARAASLSPGALALTVVWTALLAGCLVASSFNRDVDIALYGCIACVLVTLPALSRSFEWISPWSMVMLAVYIGCGVRGFAILDHGLSSPLVTDMYLRGRSITEYGWPAFLFLSGLALLSLGYAIGGRRRQETETRPGRWATYEFGGQFWLVVFACAGIGAYAFWQYVQATGGFDPSTLSAKRTAFYVGPNSRYAGGAGQWRALNELASVAFWLAVAKNARSDGPRLGRSLVIAALFVNAVALPAYSSTRAQVIYIVLTGLVVNACLSPRMRFRSVVRAGGIALALLSVLTFMRQQSEGNVETFSPITAVRSVSDAAVLNLNFTEVPKAVNVIEAVPENLPYSHGSTIWNYAVAPIPRSMWPGKPIIDPGVAVGVRVYHTDGTAIPPGAIAEFYWAYGTGALVVLSFLLGFGLRRLFEATRTGARSSVAGALLYSSAVFDLGANAVSGSVGYAVSSALLAAATMWVALRLAGGATSPPSPSQPSRSPSRTASSLSPRTR